jgi:hypothetical protein
MAISESRFESVCRLDGDGSSGEVKVAAVSGEARGASCLRFGGFAVR